MLLASNAPFPKNFENSSFYAAHVVAGAIMEALKAIANIDMLFANMVNYLDIMHQYNTEWDAKTPPSVST